MRERVKTINTFSFLYRNERTATIFAPMLYFAMSKLSVSSIGTNELQQYFYTYDNELLHTLSVSSIGTNELQPQRMKND